MTVDLDQLIEDVLERSSTIAVVGLSSNPARPSNTVASYLLQAGFTILPVNPNEREVFGIPAYSSLEEIDKPVDIVNVFRRPQEVPDVARSAVATGAGAIWMQPGAESPEAEEIGRNAGIDVISGPCIMVQHRLLTIRKAATTAPDSG